MRGCDGRFCSACADGKGFSQGSNFSALSPSVLQRLGRVRFIGGGDTWLQVDALLAAKLATGLCDDRCDLGAG